mmetsp:Transcript_26634/g.83354  ORF Transcript_26634/g.83354 Transcript_26634/m.83354 type:complete len:345 (-) Transcript_26634:542-1576(-)
MRPAKRKPSRCSEESTPEAYDGLTWFPASPSSAPVVTKKPYCGSKTSLHTASIHSLSKPPPSMPASSMPCSLTKVTWMRPRSGRAPVSPLESPWKLSSKTLPRRTRMRLSWAPRLSRGMPKNAALCNCAAPNMALSASIRRSKMATRDLNGSRSGTSRSTREMRSSDSDRGGAALSVMSIAPAALPPPKLASSPPAAPLAAAPRAGASAASTCSAWSSDWTPPSGTSAAVMQLMVVRGQTQRSSLAKLLKPASRSSLSARSASKRENLRRLLRSRSCRSRRDAASARAISGGRRRAPVLAQSSACSTILRTSTVRSATAGGTGLPATKKSSSSVAMSAWLRPAK